MTPNYRLISQLDDRESTAWMKDFDQFIVSTTDIMSLDVRSLPPLTVVIFKSDKEYTPYKLRMANGKAANVAGQFMRRQTWSMIGMGHDMRNQNLRRTIQHEATHWLMSVDPGRQPAWFSEGIAEMFSTFERKGDKVNWAKPINEHLQFLQGAGTMPFEQFLVAPSALFERDEHTGLFYAQSWAFTHFLMVSQNSVRRPLLIKFLHDFRTQSGEAAVNSVFGPSLPQVKRDFQLYINQRSFAYMVQPAKMAPAPPALEPARDVFVEASLGMLAMGTGQAELARKHADQAIALDKEAPDGYALLAYLALEKNDFPEAATQADAAMKRGSKDGNLFVLLGDSFASGPNSEKPNANLTRVNLYENAININPKRRETYHRLTEALFTLETPREEDERFLNTGLKVFPGDDWISVGTAVVNRKLGRAEAAMTSVNNALRSDSTLDVNQRTYASNLKRNWLLESLASEIQAASSKSDFAGARAVVARYREQISSDPDLTRYFDETDTHLELADLMHRYTQAQRAAKKAEARALAEKLLARKDLPEEFRTYLLRYEMKKK